MHYIFLQAHLWILILNVLREPGVLVRYYISVMTDMFVEDEVFIGSWNEWVSLVGQWDSTQEE